MLDDTLRRNIAMGVPDEKIDEDLINQVVALAQLSDYVSNAPNGLDTIVGENAARISGGEKQRIGIARALYANASVLILDEITSALDDLTEASIIDIFEGFKRDKTIIMVTHKKSTVAKCDKIFELNQGQIVER
jgi:ABC-type multidrug transport system fused ATPase/permease subunit